MRARGLTEEEAARRLSARPPHEPATSRSYASIVRANVFTVFNLILAVAGTATLVFGEWQDALFLGVLFSNAAIGITQEVRAKRALDRLAALVEPTATVVRDGVARTASVEEVVVGDLLRIQAGDQVVADGKLVSASRPRARRVDPDGRVAAGRPRRGESACAPARSSSRERATFEVERGRRAELCGADHRRGADLPTSALAARARAQPPADHARRGDRAARDRPRDRALGTAHAARRGRAHVRRRGRYPRPGRADPPCERDVRRRGASDGPPRRPRAAAERDRVARFGGRRLSRQDGNADRATARGPSPASRRGRRRRRARGLGGGLRCGRARAQRDRRRPPRTASRGPRTRHRRPCRSLRGAASAQSAPTDGGSSSARRSCSSLVRSSRPQPTRRRRAVGSWRSRRRGTGSRPRLRRVTCRRSGSRCSASGCAPRPGPPSTSSGARASS